MAETTSIDIGGWRGRKAVDPGGSGVGSVEEIYYDERSDEPLFLLLKGGIFGGRRRFVPARGAREWGEQIVVAYDEDTIKAAPGIDADGELTAGEEEELYRHYGIAVDDTPEPASQPAPEAEAAASGPAPKATEAQQAAAGARATDDAMTRSEEELHIVGHETRPRERVRLKKYQVTDYVTMRVPVTREEVRLEREPVAPAEGERVVDVSEEPSGESAG